MNLARLWTHLVFPTRWRVQKAFPPATRAAIHAAIESAEASHRGQIRFAVEGTLDPRQLLADLSARARALDVFSLLRIWDTEHNNGVLIYVLLADRDVEIVADRGIHARVDSARWKEIAKAMEERFAVGQFQEGSLLGIQWIAKELEVHFPAQDAGPNELPDEVVLL
ncbi:MAG: TPM domain-containing protein [Burkholderiaceae bacterium]|jgi:uncharacterized membrane protein